MQSILQPKFLTILVTLVVVFKLSMIIKPSAAAFGLKENEILRIRNKYPMDDELGYLPKCCTARRISQKYRGRETSIPSKVAPYVNKCRKQLGERLWTYMHHHCAGLNRMMRYYRSKQAGFGLTSLTKSQTITLKAAIGEFRYSESHYAGYLQYITAMKLKATAQWELGLYRESIDTLQVGIQAMPRHPTLHIELAKRLITLGSKAAARRVLEKGLKSTNGNKQIRDMLVHLK